VLYVPIKFRVYRDFIAWPRHAELGRWTLWPLPELFADFCRTEGLPCLDLTGPLRDAVGRGAMPYALADSHWSPEGHELVAHELADVLASFGWIPSPRRAE
jgi:SGNH hydrolase-like domain, acetyltransferase AlgX